MKTILFIKINPIGTINLRLDEEEKALREVLYVSAHRDEFAFESRGAVTTNDLHQYLEQIKPTILHISGHGNKEGVLFFHDSEGHKKEVPVLKFYGFLKNFDTHLESVFLNACFSMSGIETITTPKFHVIGMKDEVPNDTALSFARAFYTSHCNGKPVKESFETAKGVVGMDGFQEELIPKFIKSTKEPTETVETTKNTETPVEATTPVEPVEEVSLVPLQSILLIKKNRTKDIRFYYTIIAILIVTSIVLVGTPFLISLVASERVEVEPLLSSIGGLPLFTLKWPFDKLERIKKALESIIILENQHPLSHQMTEAQKVEFNDQFRRILEAKL